MNDPVPRSLGIVAAVFLFFAFTTGTHAAEITIFHMADGSYYHPASGIRGTAEEEVLQQLKTTSDSVTLVSAPAIVTEASASVPRVKAPKVFQMADGAFYDPRSGLHAASANDLYIKLGLDPNNLIFENVASSLSADAEQKAPLIAAVERAQASLQKQIDEDDAKRFTPEIVTSDSTWRNVMLAVWNKRTEEISFLKGRKNGMQLELEQDADVKVARTNYVNSEYVLGDKDTLVVAVRYPILKKIATAKYEVHDVVYSPFSKDLFVPDLIQEGEDYINNVADQAFQAMRDKQVPSRAYPGKLMADVVDKDLLKTLIIIEHSDITSLSRNPEDAVNRVLATFGLNKGSTYNYAKSGAGALGIAQFMPSTYTSFVRRTQLALTPDFEAGMFDHENAVRAQAAYLDDALASLPPVTRELGMGNAKVKEYLAASYNGGYAKVKTAMQIWDEQISGELAPYEIKSRSRLHAETIQYVKKLRYALPQIMGMNPQTQTI